MMQEALSRLETLMKTASSFENIFQNENGEELDFCLSNSHLSEVEAFKFYVDIRKDVDSYSDKELDALARDIHSFYKDGKKVTKKIPSSFNTKEYLLRSDLSSFSDKQLYYFRDMKEYFADMPLSIEGPVDYEKFLELHQLPEIYFNYIQDADTHVSYKETVKKLIFHEHPKTTQAINNILKANPNSAKPDEKIITAFLISLTHRIILEYLSPLDKQISKIIDSRNKSRLELIRAFKEPQIVHGLLKEPLLSQLDIFNTTDTEELLEGKAVLHDQIEKVDKAIDLFNEVLLFRFVLFGSLDGGGSGKKKNPIFNEIIDLVVDFYVLLTGKVPPTTKDDSTHNSLFKKLLKAIFSEIFIRGEVLNGEIEGSKQTSRYLNNELNSYLPGLISSHAEYSGKSLDLKSVFRFSLHNVELFFHR